MNNTIKSLKVRLSPRMIVLCLLFTFFVLVIGYGIVFMNTHTIYMDDGTMPVFFKVFMTAVCAVIEAGLLFMVIPMWKRIFKDGAMTLTKEGIENTFILFTLLAFWTTFKIRFIPWNALIADESDDDGYLVDVKLLPPGSVGAVAKFLLKITGFNFQIGKIKKEDIEVYRQRALAQNEENKTALEW